jgi:DNA-binding transcriptional ArsR family regulator
VRPEPARVFAALGDPVRLALVETLADGRPRSIAEFARGLTRQGVTKHLRVLEGASVLTAEHAGRETRFRAETETLACARDYLTRVAEAWDDALLRLKEHVETDQERLTKPSDTVGEVRASW